jgi:hypothetical protein
LCYDRGNAEPWKVQLDNLGLREMQLQGLTPNPGAPQHPAVRDWLLGQLDVGTDLNRVVGRTISEPHCEKRSHTCQQYADKQLFIFDERATRGEQVRRAPLGLWQTYTRTHPTGTSEPPVFNLPLLGLAGVLAAAGLLLLIMPRKRLGPTAAV